MNNLTIKQQTVIVVVLLCCVLGFSIAHASQPVGHFAIGKLAWDMAPQDYDFFGMKVDTRVPATIFSHIVADRLIDEAGLGEYQEDIGLVRLMIMYACADNEGERDEFLAVAFWSLFPDLIDKTFNTAFFHDYGIDPILGLTRDENELFEEILLFSYVVEL